MGSIVMLSKAKHLISKRILRCAQNDGHIVVGGWPDNRVGSVGCECQTVEFSVKMLAFVCGLDAIAFLTYSVWQRYP